MKHNVLTVGGISRAVFDGSQKTEPILGGFTGRLTVPPPKQLTGCVYAVYING
jgi:hypothetical protein